MTSAGAVPRGPWNLRRPADVVNIFTGLLFFCRVSNNRCVSLDDTAERIGTVGTYRSTSGRPRRQSRKRNLASGYLRDMAESLVIPIPVQRMSLSGIYLLKRGGVIVYVGQANNIAKRIGNHLFEGLKSFDEVSIIPCDERSLDRIEAKLIELFVPEYNLCHIARGMRDGGPAQYLAQQKCAAEFMLSEAEAVAIAQLFGHSLSDVPTITTRLPRSSKRVTRYSSTEVFGSLSRRLAKADNGCSHTKAGHSRGQRASGADAPQDR